MKLRDLIGKELQIYPGDTQEKFGILEEISSEGYLFKITKSETRVYSEGDIVFFSHGNDMSFKLAK